MKWLSSIFAIDLCAYAVMNNHYHVVLRIDLDKAKKWSDREVAERWTKMFSGPMHIRRWLDDRALGESEIAMMEENISTWRSRLYDLSWYMRCLNEAIARMANQEDKCTGRFWEGRFKSQALLDERALLACMAYVDLNPIRAAIAKTPEESDYTSIQQRIRYPANDDLLHFSDGVDWNEGLPYGARDYLEFVDWAGRAIQNDKKGHIPLDTPRIFHRLVMDKRVVVDYVLRKQDLPIRAMGPWSRLRIMAKSVGMKFMHGKSLSEQLCPELR